MCSVRTWFILHTAWVAAQGEFWHLHRQRLSASHLPSCALPGRAGGCTATSPSCGCEGSPPKRSRPSSCSPLHLQGSNRSPQESLRGEAAPSPLALGRPSWRMASDPQPCPKQSWNGAAVGDQLTTWKLQPSSTGRKILFQSYCSGKTFAMPKVSDTNNRTESHTLLLGRKSSWATPQLSPSTFGELDLLRQLQRSHGAEREGCAGLGGLQEYCEQCCVGRAGCVLLLG